MYDLSVVTSDEFAAPTRSSDTGRAGPSERVGHLPALTILAHPDHRRVGEICCLYPGDILIARATPAFSPLAAPEQARPLASDFLSKTPSLHLNARIDGSLALERGASDHAVKVNGDDLVEPRVLPRDDIERSVLMTIGSRFALCVHTLRQPVERSGGALGFVGTSDAMERVRSTIRKLADHDVPVLIRGESGTGKELVATALHTTGKRRAGPLVQLNMGELGTTAASELFGHEKGAFTGAVSDRAGYFTQAHGGTIFLDEIGLASIDVQKMLLRVVEDGQVRPMNGRAARRVDVRIVTATDAELEADVQAKRFHAPLFVRLAGYTIWLPPLRQRRQDIGLLLHHFLERSLVQLGAQHRLDQTVVRRPWLSATSIAQLAMLDWPGNIRALRNLAQRIAIDYHNQPEADVTRAIANALGSHGAAAVDRPGETAPSRPSRSRLRVAPADLTRDQIEQVLRQHAGNMTAAARSLGIAKGSLYELTRRHDIVTTTSITTEQLLEAHKELDGDLRALARRFGVSLRALQLRLHSLGLPSRTSDGDAD